MNDKHEIEIPGLPEGWKAVAYRVPTDKIDYVLTDDCEIILANNIRFPCLIVEKIPPRRIVLEETEKDNFKYTNGFYANQVLGNGIHIVDQPKIWREVKEGERSSTTFRERVINDLVHNRIISEGE